MELEFEPRCWSLFGVYHNADLLVTAAIDGHYQPHRHLRVSSSCVWLP